MSSDAEQLLATRSGSVVAAAGCGKTELIARAVASAPGRQLVLTHTNAGVEAIRYRLRRCGVANDHVAVDTLDGWCLKYVSAYPMLSGGVQLKSDGLLNWKELRASMPRLLQHATAQKVILASYEGVFVDEYQDCVYEQHEIVVAIKNLLPVRVLGDPLQCVFRFQDNDPVHWPDVEAAFPPILRLSTPWRWKRPGENEALGAWLSRIRREVEHNGLVDFRDSRISYVPLVSGKNWLGQARDACFRVAALDGSVVGVLKWGSECQLLGKLTGGYFQNVETIDAKDAARMLARFESSPALERASILLEFLRAVAIHVDNVCDPLLAHFSAAAPVPTGLEEAARLLRVVQTGGTARDAATALDALSTLPEVRPFRRELLWAALDAFRDIGDAPPSDLLSALRRRRNLTSHAGRRLARCSTGSTLLVKGMEFDHAVVVHTGGANGFSVNDLYVALTRASKSLTVLSVVPQVDLRRAGRR